MALTAAQLEALRDSPQSASTDAGSMSARSADDVLKLDDRAAATTALSGTNDQGGPKSIWSKLRPAQAKLPGGV